MMNRIARWTAPFALAGFVILSTFHCRAQITNYERGDVQAMFQQIAPDIQKHYYDPKFHGVDWNAEITETTQKINSAKTLPHALAAVASALLSLNDSHTVFIPPSYSTRYDYGWQAQIIGNRCFIVRVRPGSDAEKKGVRPGDEVLAINGFVPERDSLWKLQYAFNILSPRPGITLALRSPDGQQRELPVAATVKKKQDILDLSNDGNSADMLNLIQQEENEQDRGSAHFISVGEDVGILKLPSFDFDKSDIDKMMSKAHKHKVLVLDLRGNPGGYTETLEYMVGAVFDKDIKVADRVSRSEHKPMIAKTHHDPFTGKLVVLVDSNSASSAELFARVIQIEKRGTVIGDQSSGKVMEAKVYPYHTGTDTQLFFGAEITDANLIMTDGKSLEDNGVVPDEVVLPTAEDLANGKDPVLAHAVELAGGKITPEAAGKMFPYKWPEI